MGIGGSSNAFVKDLPLFIAFAVLAAYTYSSGLRAPALIAFVKDTLIYLVIIVAVIYIADARSASAHLRRGADEDGHDQPGDRQADRGVHPAAGAATGRTPRWRWARRWRCSCTRTRSPRCCRPSGRNVIRRNAAILPAYSLVLGLLALLGFAAIARRHVKPIGLDGKPNAQLAVPQLFEDRFPSWFAGDRLRGHRDRRAGAGGDHVDRGGEPVHPQHLPGRSSSRDATPQQEATVSKIASLVVKVGALVFVLGAGQAERDQPAAARRDLDPADVPGDRARPVHPVVPPLGAARRLGGGHGLRHGRGVPADQPGDQALRRVAGQRPVRRHSRLHRDDRVRAQPGRGGRADRRLAGDEHPGRRGRDASRRTTTPTRATRGSSRSTS